jgi:hypothetical protein
MTLPSSRPSFAARVRGWHDEATALEQRFKDLETFERSHRRRWAMAATVLLLGVLGKLAGMVPARLGTIVLIAGAGAVVNALVGIINERGWYRWWFIYMLALLDVALVNVLVMWFGHGGIIAALFIAVLPYAFDQGQAVGDFLVLVGSLGYCSRAGYTGSCIRRDWSRGDRVSRDRRLHRRCDGAQTNSATLIRRIRHARSVMEKRSRVSRRAAAVRRTSWGFSRKLQSHARGDRGDDFVGPAEADEVAAFAETGAAANLHATTES